MKKVEFYILYNLLQTGNMTEYVYLNIFIILNFDA